MYPNRHPEATAAWDREAASYDEGPMSPEERQEYEAWLDGLPAGFPEPEGEPCGQCFPDRLEELPDPAWKSEGPEVGMPPF